MMILSGRRTAALTTIATLAVAAIGGAAAGASPHHPATSAKAKATSDAAAKGSRVSSLLGVAVVPKSATAWAFGQHGTPTKQSYYAIVGSGKKWKSVAVKAPMGGTLTSIAAGSAKDIWIVGKVEKGTKSKPLVMHSSGGAFTVEKTKIGDGGMTEVSASSATNAWAIGVDRSGTYQMYETVKGKWTIKDPGPDNGGYIYTGIGTSSPDNTWLTTVNPGNNTPFGESWNGQIFSTIFEDSQDINGTFDAVATSSPTSTIMVGDVPATVAGKPALVVASQRWDKAKFEFVDVPVPSVGKLSTFGSSVTMVGSKAYLVGQTLTKAGAQPLAEGYNKGKWTVEKSASAGKLSLLVSVASSTKVAVAVGSGDVNPKSQTTPSGHGLLEVLQGKTWKAVRVPS